MSDKPTIIAVGGSGEVGKEICTESFRAVIMVAGSYVNNTK